MKKKKKILNFKAVILLMILEKHVTSEEVLKRVALKGIQF